MLLQLFLVIRTFAQGFFLTPSSQHNVHSPVHVLPNRHSTAWTVKHRNAVSLSISQGQQETTPTSNDLFPVIRHIEKTNWTGSCRYVGVDLVHASKLKLFGGVRYDIDWTSNTVTLSSFLTFPNGKTREVVMQGTAPANGASTMKLTSVEEGGPVYMLVTELAPDTILINEVEEGSGKTVLTASLSVVKGTKGMELVQISHEVGNKAIIASIDGHQVWRLSKAPTTPTIQFDDFDLRGTTGR